MDRTSTISLRAFSSQVGRGQAFATGRQEGNPKDDHGLDSVFPSLIHLTPPQFLMPTVPSQSLSERRSAAPGLSTMAAPTRRTDATANAAGAEARSRKASPLPQASQPPAKRQRSTKVEEPLKVSLLSRLQPAPPSASASPSSTTPPALLQSLPSNKQQAPGGFSIKGAAKTETLEGAESLVDPLQFRRAKGQQRQQAQTQPLLSLLDRLQAPPSTNSNGSGPATSRPSKRKRGR